MLFYDLYLRINNIVQLKAMYSVAPEVVKPVLDGLKGGMLENKLYEMIFNKDRAKKG